MSRTPILSSAIVCLFLSLPCVAQELAPVIRLSTDEATKAKQLAQDVVDAKERSAKGKLAWEQFHQTYQAAHADLPGLRFSQDLRLAFAFLKLSEKLSEVAQVVAIELTADERKKLEALHQETTVSEQSQKRAEKNWQEFQYQLVVDHVGTSSTGGTILMLAGKQITIPSPWGRRACLHFRLPVSVSTTILLNISMLVQVPGEVAYSET